MCVAHAWCASLFWHGATVRLAAMQRGQAMFYGTPKLWMVWGATVVALIIFGCSQ